MAYATDVNGQVRQNLKDAGCGEELIGQFFEFLEANRSKDGFHLLQEHRNKLLASVHQNQKRIDCLDYLICNRTV